MFIETDHTLDIDRTDYLFFGKLFTRRSIAHLVQLHIKLYQPNPKAGKILGDQDPIAKPLDPMDIYAVY